MRKATSLWSLRWCAARVAFFVTVQQKITGAPVVMSGSEPHRNTASLLVSDSPTLSKSAPGSDGVFFSFFGRPRPSGPSESSCFPPMGESSSTSLEMAVKLKPVPRERLLVTRFCNSRLSYSGMDVGTPHKLISSSSTWEAVWGAASKKFLTVAKMSSSRIRKSPKQTTKVSPLNHLFGWPGDSSTQIWCSNFSSCRACPMPVGRTVTQSFSTTTSAGAESKGPAQR
mmetsp:Transcript_4347/g.16376  ORF Transcript_4347/g.16376 Transcript_4347/m.16376 type:complete len:227 (+) Transcript_4347:239-919(+)